MITCEVEIPSTFIDLSAIFAVQRELDAAVCGFDPEAVALRSAWVDVLFGGGA